MKKDQIIRRLLYLLIVVFLSEYSFGQLQNIDFDRYTTKEGLSNGYVNTIFQDSKGFIWIGTANGLNRFDGINFKNYYYDANDTTSICGSSVNSLTEDSLGNIWVLTSTGLCVYDRKKDNFFRKTFLVNGVIIVNPHLSACYLDGNGFLWIACYQNGISRFKIDNKLNTSNIINSEGFLLDEYDIKDSPNRKNIIFSIVAGNDKRMWVSSYSNMLFYFDVQKNKFVSYPINHSDADSFTLKEKILKKDSSDDFYMSIENIGLLEWNRKANTFSLHKSNGGNNQPQGAFLSAIVEDRDGSLWIGDRISGGISILNRKTKTFSYCRSEESNPFSLITDKINYLFRDRDGAIWIGTIIGLNKYSPDKLKFRRYISNPKMPDQLNFNNILCFDESKTGSIWIGTDGGGLNELNRETGKFTHFMNDPSNPNTISSNAIISVCEDHEGVVWMGSYGGGLIRMENGKFKNYLPDPSNAESIGDKNIWCVLEDSKKNLWIATLINGLDLFDRKTNRFYHFTKNPNDSTSIGNSTIYGIYEDSKQNIYITGNRGVSIFNLNDIDYSKTTPSIKFKTLTYTGKGNSLSSMDIHCVMEDHENNVWFGTYDSGLDKMDLETGKVTNYSTKDGLPGNSITSILIDDHHFLWLATDNGLVKFNPKTKEIKVFGTKDGLQSNGLKSWPLKTKDGEMFFGGPDGFNSFYPEDIKFNQNKPLVFITGLKIFNKPVKINEKFNGKILLKNNISESTELTLNYRENFFTFEFIALDYTTPEKNNYAYKMEGFDNDWVQCGTKREANYTNLDPGEYLFRVKASNNDGVWNDEGTSIRVTILPPWWQTWWFRSFAILAIISLTTFIFILRVSRLKKQKAILETMVEKKTYELREINSILFNQAEELKQTNYLLNEKNDKIEEQREELSAQKESLQNANIELYDLNATKDKFFSIIAHDIKNPFNAILGFTELLEENFNDWDDEMKLETINIVLHSSKNLYQLLENLLQWSRSQRGIIDFNPQKIELKETFNNVLELMKGSAEAKNIELEYELQEEGLTVHADKQMLDTIMRNLISNALKFTNVGGKVLVVAESNKDAVNIKVMDNEFVNIKVTDNGVGIHSEVKDKLFRIDSNVSTSGTANEKGTGLGLILVKEFVTRHGGSIGVESSVGIGTTFYFTLSRSNS